MFAPMFVGVLSAVLKSNPLAEINRCVNMCIRVTHDDSRHSSLRRQNCKYLEIAINCHNN